MTDNASFGLNIDSSGVDKANQSLNQFQTAARGAADAARQHETASDRMNRQMEDMIRLQQQANSAIQQQTSISQQASDATETHRRHMVELGVAVAGLAGSYEVARRANQSFMTEVGSLTDRVTAMGKALTAALTGPMAGGALDQFLSRTADIASRTGTTSTGVLQNAAIGNTIGIPDASQVSLLQRMAENMHGVTDSAIAARMQMASLGITTRDMTQATEQAIVVLSKMQEGIGRTRIAQTILGPNFDPATISPMAGARLETNSPAERYRYQTAQDVARGQGYYASQSQEEAARRERDQTALFGLTNYGSGYGTPGPLGLFNNTTSAGIREQIANQMQNTGLYRIFNGSNGQSDFGGGVSQLGQGLSYEARTIGASFGIGSFPAIPKEPVKNPAPASDELKLEAESFQRFINPAARANRLFEQTQRRGQSYVNEGALSQNDFDTGIKAFKARLDALQDPFGVFTAHLVEANAVAALPEGRDRAFAALEQQARHANDPYNPLNPKQLTPKQEGQLHQDFDAKTAAEGDDLVNKMKRQADETAQLAAATGQGAGALNALKAGFEAHEIALAKDLDAVHEHALATELLNKSFADLALHAADIAKHFKEQADDSARVNAASPGGPRAVRAAQDETAIRRQMQDARDAAKMPREGDTLDSANDRLATIQKWEDAAIADARRKRDEDERTAATTRTIERNQRIGSMTGDDDAALTRHYENGGGNPYAGVGGKDLRNAPIDQYGAPIWAGKGNSHAFGDYQFQPGEWARYAPRLGVTDWRAPGAQRKVFDAAHAAEGWAPWAPYDSGLAAAVGWNGPSGASLAGRGFRRTAQGESNAGQLPPSQLGSEASGLAAESVAQWSNQQQQRNQSDVEGLALQERMVQAAHMGAAAEKEITDEIRIQNETKKAMDDATASGDPKSIALVQQRRTEMEGIAAAQRQLGEDKTRANEDRQNQDSLKDLQAEVEALKQGSQAYEKEKAVLEEINKLKAAGVEITQQDVQAAKDHADAMQKAQDQVKVQQDAASDLSGSANNLLDAARGGLSDFAGAQNYQERRSALLGMARSGSNIGLSLFEKPLQDLIGNVMNGNGWTFNVGQSGESRSGAWMDVLSRAFGGGGGPSGGSDTGGDTSSAPSGGSDTGGDTSSAPSGGSDTSGLPSYDVGGLIPHDQVARVHQGELIIPASLVPRFADGGDVTAGMYAGGALQQDDQQQPIDWSNPDTRPTGVQESGGPTAQAQGGGVYQSTSDIILGMIPKVAGAISTVAGGFGGGDSSGGSDTGDSGDQDFSGGTTGDGSDYFESQSSTDFSGGDMGAGADWSGVADNTPTKTPGFTGGLERFLGSGLGGDKSILGRLFGAGDWGYNAAAPIAPDPNNQPQAYANGGMAGQGASIDFRYAPHFANGGLLPDEVPAVLHTGERVLNRRETNEYNSNRGSGGSSGGSVVHAPINVYTNDANSFRASAGQIATHHQRQLDRATRNL